MSTTLAGRFVWRELITPEPAAAAKFYGDLFGWTSKSTAMPGMDYTLLRHGTLNEDVAGAMAPRMAGVPPHWLPYITVDDVDAAATKIAALGGKVVVPPMSVPGVGRWTVAVDPTGGTFAAFTGETPGATADRTPPTGTFCWAQLMTNNVDVAVGFYRQLLGWSAEAMGDTVVLSTGETMRATAMAFPPGMDMGSHWLNYVAVDAADASFARAVELGAKAIVPPSDIPNMGRFGVLQDPTGAYFAVWQAQRA
jgi:predicted enzyme related to lactoylglutathione lyase